MTSNNQDSAHEDEFEIKSESVKKIEQIVHGNINSLNQNPNISVKLSTIKTYTIPAKLSFTLEHSTTSNRLTGKHVQGKIVASEQEIQTSISDYIHNLQTDPNITQQLHILIAQQNDNFSKHSKLPQFSTDFTVHNPCAKCQHTGKNACAHCQATGRTACLMCKGRKQIPCNNCRGTGIIQNSSGSRTNCIHCQQKGYISCRSCNATGISPCKSCQQSGHIKCNDCAGAGVSTIIYHVEPELNSSFLVKPDAELPSHLSKQLENNTIKLKNQNAIRLVEEEKRDNEIDYTLKIPYGSITYKIQTKKPFEITGELYGYNLTLCNFDPFLQTGQLCKKPIQMLLKHAKGLKSNSTLIKILQNNKLIREGFITSCSQTNKIAYKEIKDKYPIGLDDKVIKTIIGASIKSSKRVTQKGRLKSLFIVLISSALTYSLYFLGPLQQQITQFIPIESLAIVPDILLLLVSLITAHISVTYSSNNALSKLLKPFMKDHQIIKAKATFSKSETVTFFLMVCIYALTIFFMPYCDKNPPLWIIDIITLF